ncbi:protein-disulfide reductase DsbD family protein [Brevundimonas sp.]|uniref:protein-disulfide reductase DsbD family protein n=1 Tax=Brevundimonas sp. TaxID=1871086 RepID=UPI0035B3A455
MRLLIRLLCLLLTVAAPITAAAQTSGPQRTDRIEAELVAMSRWAAPGSTAVVAVRQDIEPGWHTYWRNPGDSGGATGLTWRLPEGVRAGDIVWPTPERQRLQGLTNYGYEGDVYLPVPVEIPAAVRPGSTVPLEVEALFFVCSDEMCVPETLTLRLDLPVREGAAPPDPRHGAAIQRVLAEAPTPAGIEARVRSENGVLTLTAVGGPLAGRDPGPSYFFPFEAGLIDHSAPQTGAWGPEGLTLVLSAGAKGQTGPATPLEGVLATSLGAFEIRAEPGPDLPGARGSGDLAPLPDAGDEPQRAAVGWTGFLQAALFALLGGLILNLMPCVFPILAMKAAALSAAAHDPARARRDGLAFLAGVLTTFLALAGLLLALRAGGEAIGWGFQLQSPAVIAGLSLLMLAVALNLSGVFHMGAGLQAAGSGPLARLPGAAGAFFTGMLAVVVAAPCTAPFMAFALGAALLMPWPMALVVFLMLGLGLALPFVLVSLTPRLLARLPRPGPWMERLKGLLAFPMYGTAAWLVWVFARQSGAEALGLLLLAAVLAAFGLWLAGLTQARRAEGGAGVVSAVAAAVALVSAIALAGVAARMPAETDTPAAQTSALPSQPWSPDAVEAARSEGRPVLVNFTADWCVTCKINERTALSSAATRRAVEKANALYLVGDWTRRDDAITAELRRHGRSGVPLYLLYAPGAAEPRVLPQLLTEGTVIGALKAASPVRPAAEAGR